MRCTDIIMIVWNCKWQKSYKNDTAYSCSSGMYGLLIRIWNHIYTGRICLMFHYTVRYLMEGLTNLNGGIVQAWMLLQGWHKVYPQYPPLVKMPVLSKLHHI
jgi:hypothetical protein